MCVRVQALCVRVQALCVHEYIQLQVSEWCMCAHTHPDKHMRSYMCNHNHVTHRCFPISNVCLGVRNHAHIHVHTDIHADTRLHRLVDNHL